MMAMKNLSQAEKANSEIEAIHISVTSPKKAYEYEALGIFERGKYIQS